jgi:hypothetical protein
MVEARFWSTGSTLNCVSLTFGCCAGNIDASKRIIAAEIGPFMGRLLFVEKFQHEVGGFFALHPGQLAYDVLPGRGVLLAARQSHQIMGVARNKQCIDYSFF